jgi:hypothetical protein
VVCGKANLQNLFFMDSYCERNGCEEKHLFELTL